jgi:transcriptional regulator with XRE-family HTH domain
VNRAFLVAFTSNGFIMQGPHVIRIVQEGCRAAGLSFSSLFRAAGLAMSAYTFWKNGQDAPRASSVLRLEHAAGRSIHALARMALRLRAARLGEPEPDLSEITSDLFHNCALLAYVTVACEQRTNSPDSETVRRLAYRLYEEENRREKG